MKSKQGNRQLPRSLQARQDNQRLRRMFLQVKKMRDMPMTEAIEHVAVLREIAMRNLQRAESKAFIEVQLAKKKYRKKRATLKRKRRLVERLFKREKKHG